MNKVIFLSGLFPSDRLNEIENNSLGTIQYAANSLSWSYVEGLSNFYNDFKIYTTPFIGNFPKQYQKIYFKSSKSSFKKNISIYCIGSILIPLISLVTRFIGLSIRLIKDNYKNKDKTTIIIYSIHTPLLLSAYLLKCINKNFKLCLIVPDLPQYMSPNNSKVYRLFKKIDSIIINKILKNIDSFILLTSEMSKFVNKAKKPEVIIEGIYNQKNVIESRKKEKRKTIMYSGTLHKVYGIENLINSFKMIENKDYRLWICGKGDYEDNIKEDIKEDSRIIYWGQLAQDKIFEMQKNATLLVNPRLPNDDYTHYSFPSKTMEYLASGTPCIMRLLPSLPEEYLQHLFISGNSDIELKNKIVEVLEYSESFLSDFGSKASKFILEKKNPISQVNKILPIIEL